MVFLDITASSDERKILLDVVARTADQVFIPLTVGGGVRIDPWSFSQLAADKQYSVVVDGGTGTVTAIVSEFASGGDNAMMYEGFAAIP